MSKSAEKLKKKRKIDAFDVVITLSLSILAFVAVYPFVQTLLTSFSSYGDVITSKFIVIPKHFNFDSYVYIFKSDVVVKPFLISLCVTVAGTLYQLILTSLGAYVLSSRTLPFRNVLLSLIIFTMFFGGGLIPFVLLVQSLGLLNSWLSLVIPFGVNSFNLILLRNYMRELPYELIEAAKVDGANELVILVRIIIPLSMPALMTIGLYCTVGTWNDWYWPMIFIEDSMKYPLALAVRSLIMNSSSDMEAAGQIGNYLDSQTKEAAVVIITILPMIALYPFVQKYFVKGMVIGAVKG